MDTMTAEKRPKPNVLIVNGKNNINRDLNFKEKWAESLSIDSNVEIDIQLVKNSEKDVISQGKWLEFLPVFAKRETDRHAKNCSKIKRKAIKETNFRGILFKQERYLASDTPN